MGCTVNVGVCEGVYGCVGVPDGLLCVGGYLICSFFVTLTYVLGEVFELQCAYF